MVQLGAPGLAGIFGDHKGLALGCFASSLRLASSWEAELHADIQAVSFAWDKGR